MSLKSAAALERRCGGGGGVDRSGGGDSWTVGKWHLCLSRPRSFHTGGEDSGLLNFWAMDFPHQNSAFSYLHRLLNVIITRPMPTSNGESQF